MSPLPTFDPGFSTEELTDLYSPESTVTALLAFEASLALALADAGLAPRAEAEATAEACGTGVEDPLAILASTWETGTPILALRDHIGGGEWFHYGATTQDAVDTAQMIQARSALSILDAHLVAIVTRLRDLTNEHRHQPQMGRTFLQDARPTTFGFRTASWLDAVAGHVVELRHQQSLLPVQLGGPVGTGDAYGDKGSEVVDALATRLGLRAPDISWHSDRSGVLALAQGVERMARTLARVGNDIALLASSSIAEVKVRSGGSSSMPEKQNPTRRDEGGGRGDGLWWRDGDAHHGADGATRPGHRRMARRVAGPSSRLSDRRRGSRGDRELSRFSGSGYRPDGCRAGGGDLGQPPDRRGARRL
jgi:3-carboxy-cis,cis-muconate cycloisomerase